MSAPGCSRRRPAPRRAEGRAAWCRALLVAAPALLATALAAVGLPLARASVEAAAERAGLDLLDRLGPALAGEPRAVTLNGERLYLASRVTSLGVAEVLAAVERQCHSGSARAGSAAADAASLQPVLTGLGSAPPPPGSPREPSGERPAPAVPGVLEGAPPAPAQPIALDAAPPALERAPQGGLAATLDPERWLLARRSDGAGTLGQLACLARRDGRPLLERLRAFARSGDLGSVGDARYVLARRAPGSEVTHALLMWTAGSFSPLALLAGPPRDAAAPRALPAPPDAEPLLSARVEGEPYALELFATAEAPSASLAWYERELARLGYAALPIGGEDPPGRRAFVNAERVVLVSAERARDLTRVALVALGRPRALAQEAP